MLVIAFITAGTFGCGSRNTAEEVPESRDISLLTVDGARLTATLYPVKRTHPAALVLVPMREADRASYTFLARALQRKGYLSIAIDLRSRGGSTGPGDVTPNHGKSGETDWLSALNDIDAAKSALLEQGADPENLALVGAGLGANLALLYASSHDDIQAIVLLSPGMTYEGIDARESLAAYGKRPLLLMTCTGDAYSNSSCERMRALAQGQCEIRKYEGSAHGTDILGAASTRQDQILLWLKSIIGPDAAAANRNRAEG